MSRKGLLYVSLICCLIIPGVVDAGGVKEARVRVKKITIFSKGINLPFFVNNRLIFSDIGNNRIKEIQRMDFLLDREGRLQGLRILFRSGIDGYKSLFIPSPKAVLFERQDARGGDEVLIRVVTMDEIINIW